MRYILIVNSRNNKSNLHRFEDAVSYVASTAPDLRCRFEFRYTEYPGHAADIALETDEKYKGQVAVVSCGGDGTVHEIVNALAFRKTPVIPIPFGTGNDLVKTVHTKSKRWKLRDYLMNLDEADYRPIDLIKIDSFDLMGNFVPAWSSYFVNVASIGLDTKVQSDAKALVAAHDTPFTRKTAYIRAAATDLFGNRANKFTYTLELEDGTTVNGHNDSYTLISICNGKYYGDGFTPAPSAEVDSGNATICVVDDVRTMKAADLIVKYRFGKHEGKSGIHMYKATSGIITTRDPSLQLFGNADGEDFFGNRVRFEVAPGSVNLGFFD
ncbi:MAG: hypothetical protein J6127_01055 [Clostridiales bacterium]|nr:hypothetical protein [Clostridiales bacterium]